MENLGDLINMIYKLKDDLEDEFGSHTLPTHIEKSFHKIEAEISGIDINLEFMIQDIVDIKEKISKIEDELTAITI